MRRRRGHPGQTSNKLKQSGAAGAALRQKLQKHIRLHVSTDWTLPSVPCGQPTLACQCKCHHDIHPIVDAAGTCILLFFRRRRREILFGTTDTGKRVFEFHSRRDKWKSGAEGAGEFWIQVPKMSTTLELRGG
eukprot:gene15931-biopygen3723